MRHRKKTYAEKHLNHIPSADDVTSTFIKENADLWETLRQPADFIVNFSNLDYSRQIALIDLLRGIMYNKVTISPAKLQKKLLDLSYDCLEMIGWKCGAYYEDGNIYYPLSDDEKKLVRMECYGSIDMRRDHELSACYKYFCKDANRGKFRLKDYDLSQSPMWRVFNQFESFRSIAPNVRRYMYKNGINPEALKVMSVSDFCDVIHKAFAKNPQSMKALFLKTGYKKRFVKSFMRSSGGREFYRQLIKDGLDERKASSLCRRMALDGCCDIDTLTVTEINFTPRILKDIKNTEFYDENFKVGDKIPDSLMDAMFMAGKESLLLARDENGLPLSKDDMPRYEVHHKNAVKFANGDHYLAKVNYPTNMVLVEHEMHRAFFHGFDDIAEVAKDNEQYFSRINMYDQNVAMLAGFDCEMHCYWDKDASLQKRIAKDKECVVNYYDMHMQQLNNIPEIAEKYNISYSKYDWTTDRHNVVNLLHKKINVSADDVNMFSDWRDSSRPTAKKEKTPRKVQKLQKKNQGNEL